MSLGVSTFMEVGSRYLPPPIVFILGQAGFEPTPLACELNALTTRPRRLNIHIRQILSESLCQVFESAVWLIINCYRPHNVNCFDIHLSMTRISP